MLYRGTEVRLRSPALKEIGDSLGALRVSQDSFELPYFP
jgi:hypothetical protein